MPFASMIINTLNSSSPEERKKIHKKMKYFFIIGLPIALIILFLNSCGKSYNEAEKCQYMIEIHYIDGGTENNYYTLNCGSTISLDAGNYGNTSLRIDEDIQHIYYTPNVSRFKILKINKIEQTHDNNHGRTIL